MPLEFHWNGTGMPLEWHWNGTGMPLWNGTGMPLECHWNASVLERNARLVKACLELGDDVNDLACVPVLSPLALAITSHRH